MSARSYTRRQLLAKAPEEDWSKHYLTFKVLSAGTITVKASGGATGKTFQYSQDGGQTWLSITSTAEAQSLGDFTAGMNILVKSVNTTLGANNGANTFNGTARINLCGNIMSLLYGDSFVGKTSVSAHYAFMRLFKGNTGLISAKHLILPVTSHGTYGGNYLYGEMFQNCTSLISGPKELPLLDGTNNCYASMFDGCISLESAPVIQLRTLNMYTGWYMFRNCHKLNYIKAMFITAPVSGSTLRMRDWVYGVASSGTFVKNSAATWENVRSTSCIPSGWTIETASE